MTVRLAVAGAGLIGQRHIEEIDASPSATLAAIVDPFPAAAEVAAKFSVPLYPSLAELFEQDKPDGVILATPNQLHVTGGLECVAAGVPVIVGKPIGDSVEAATTLVEAGEAADVPVLTGHHRNYSPLMSKAREIIRSGALGAVVAVVGTALFYKPDDYFEAGGGWRRQPGGGPILLNLIHEVNNLPSLVGDIVRVQAVTSNATRVFAVEDTAAMIFTFANGALGTFLLSRHGCVTAVLGADLAGEQEVRQLSGRGLLPHRRNPRFAVGAHHAAQGVPGRRILVGAVHLDDREGRPERPARPPDRAFHCRHPR